MLNKKRPGCIVIETGTGQHTHFEQQSVQMRMLNFHGHMTLLDFSECTTCSDRFSLVLASCQLAYLSQQTCAVKPSTNCYIAISQSIYTPRLDPPATLT